MRQRQQQQESLARVLAYILGRRPDEYGLIPDADGWLPVKELLRVLSQDGQFAFVRLSHLEELAHLTPAPRIELDQGRIRAAVRDLPRPQPVDQPPPLLYRAVTAKSHPVAAAHGLKPDASGHLLLAATPEMALKIGRRRDPKAVLATVQAKAAARDGIAFRRYGEDLYLADGPLSPEYVGLPPLPPEPPGKAVRKDKPAVPAAPPTPGSVLLDIAGQPLKPWKQKGGKKEPDWKQQTRKDRRRRGGPK